VIWQPDMDLPHRQCSGSYTCMLQQALVQIGPRCSFQTCIASAAVCHKFVGGNPKADVTNIKTPVQILVVIALKTDASALHSPRMFHGSDPLKGDRAGEKLRC